MMQRKNCEVCGNEFQPNVHNQKYCSKCKKYANKKKYDEWKEKTHGYKIGFLKCKKCGKEIRRVSNNHKYCDECKEKVVRTWRKEYNRNLYPNALNKLKPRKCDCCKKIFIPNIHNQKRCSDKCVRITSNENIRNGKWNFDEEKRKKYFKKWCDKNIIKLRIIRNEANKRKRSTPEGKLRDRIASRISAVIKGGNGSPRTNELLGCTPKFLREYLELQFTGDMNWEELMKGNIHIDHIKPCAAFDLTKPEEQTQCFNYSNLQPLWKKDNLTKNSKYQGKLYRKKAKNQLNLKTFLNL